MFADVRYGMICSSAPNLKLPKLSPTSQLRSKTFISVSHREQRPQLRDFALLLANDFDRSLVVHTFETDNLVWSNLRQPRHVGRNGDGDARIPTDRWRIHAHHNRFHTR